MTLFDKYQSRENGKHTLRTMKENVRQGFWNGSLPPIGYRIVEAERRGAKVKKTLTIDPMHADTVSLMYRLALSGDGTTRPMGVKAIVEYLNDRRICTRDGGRWGIGQTHKTLTRTTYVGRHRFNMHGKGKTRNSDDEVITMAVPPLIDQATFDAVQAHLRARNVEAPWLCATAKRAAIAIMSAEESADRYVQMHRYSNSDGCARRADRQAYDGTAAGSETPQDHPDTNPRTPAEADSARWRRQA